jgi:hypothetical protein
LGGKFAGLPIPVTRENLPFGVFDPIILVFVSQKIPRARKFLTAVPQFRYAVYIGMPGKILIRGGS